MVRVTLKARVLFVFGAVLALSPIDIVTLVPGDHDVVDRLRLVKDRLDGQTTGSVYEIAVVVVAETPPPPPGAVSIATIPYVLSGEAIASKVISLFFKRDYVFASVYFTSLGA